MFPSQIRTAVRALSERLDFLDDLLKEIAPGEARYEEMRKARDAVAAEIAKNEQELAKVEVKSAGAEAAQQQPKEKIVSTADKSVLEASVKIPFNAWSTDRLAKGQKMSTSRTSQFGRVGDTFTTGGRTFEITSVVKKSLNDIAHNYYLDEGAKSPEEFQQVWESLHPGGFKPSQMVFFHQFRELTPEVVELKKLLARPQLTKFETQRAVSLTQKVYKTESRDTLTPEENLALNKQVRKNLAESYTQLFGEGEISAAKVTDYRKRQLVEEYNTLLEIKKKAPVPEVPEVPPLSPATDKNYVKNVENFPFITFEQPPLINYVIKPKDARVSDFAPEWFGIHDTPDTLPPVVPPTAEETITNWFQYRRYALKEAKEDQKGIVSLPWTEFDSRVIGVPTEIKSSLFVKKTPEELDAIRKAENRADETEIIKEIKEKGLFINKGKPGWKLVPEDFYEPRLADDGTVYYKPAFFRTKEGTIQYAGDNPQIMQESRLSQDSSPRTTLVESSVSSSSRLEQMMKERGEAYHYEQFDRDIILSNKGLPLKSDSIAREQDRFEKEFVINFMINHPDQLKPWLDKADPRTIKYLNDVMGGEEVLRRKWLPQIEVKGKLVDISEKRTPVKGAIDEIGWSPEKIRTAVEGTVPDRSKNTVIYITDKEIPKDPKDYAAFVSRLRAGKEEYITKIGEEIDVQAPEKLEPGLGISVSPDILDLLKPGDVPKGIRISSPLIETNEVQVVRYVPPLKSIADYKPLDEAWAKGMGDITRQIEGVREEYPSAVQGRIVSINNNPQRFGASQEGIILTDDGKQVQFVTYKKDSPPTLEKNQRYVLKNPGETIEGSRTIARVTRDNIEEANFPSQQISTRGIVLDVTDVNNPKGTAQYGHLISPVGGKVIKFTTFSRDNPPALEKGKMYTIYNSFLQGFQTDAGNVELNINIKPENLYPEKAALTKEQKAAAEEVRTSLYRTALHPTDYKPFTGQSPKPPVQPVANDPAIATTMENGKIMVITKSGRKMTGAEYQKEYGVVGTVKKVGVAQDDATLNQIEEDLPPDDDLLFMMGLLPAGVMGASPLAPMVSGGLQGITTGGPAEASPQPVARKSAASQTIEGLAGAYDVTTELSGIWAKKLTETYQRAVEREADYEKEAKGGTISPYRKYLPIDIGITALDVVGSALYPLAFPSQAFWGTQAGQTPMEGIRNEVRPAQVLNIENPLEGLAADIVLDPLNLLAGAGLVNKVSKGEEVFGGLNGLTKGLPEFLKNEDAVLGRESNAWDQWTRLFEPGSEVKTAAKLPTVPGPDYSEVRLANKVKRDMYEASVARRKAGFEKLKTATDEVEFSKVYDEIMKADEAAKSQSSIMTRKESYDEQSVMLMLRASLPEDTVRRVDKIELQRMGWCGDEITQWYERMGSLNQPVKEPEIPIVSAPETRVKLPVEPEKIEVSQPPSPPVGIETPAEPPISIEVPEEPAVPIPATFKPPEIVAPVQVATAEEAPVTIKELRRKKILLEQEVNKKGAGSQFPWGKAAIIGTGAAALGFGAYSWMESGTEEPVPGPVSTPEPYDFALPNATYPMTYPNVTYPVKAPIVGAENAKTLSQILQESQDETRKKMSTEIGPYGIRSLNATSLPLQNMTFPVRAPVVGEEQQTAMGAGSETTPGHAPEGEKSFLGKVFDVLQTGSYLEGAAITGAQSLLAGKGLEYEWGTTPSEALGLKSKDEGMFDSWSGFFGTGMDILVDPTTYLSIGTGTAAKVGVKEGVTIALNPKGLKAMQEFTKEALAKGISKKEAEAMFTDTLTNPAIAKKFEPSAGLVLRGWGPLSSYEVELVSKANMAKAAGMPKAQWESMLRKMATSGNPAMEHAAEYLFDAGAYTGAKASAVKDKIGKAFTPFYDIKKTVPRPVNLPLGESEYADKFMLFKKGVRYKSDVYFRKYELLRAEAKKELGEGYEEIISKYVEAPVLMESANLSPKTREIISVIQTDMKSFAEAETERGLLDSSVDAYLRHILTKEAKEYLAATKKTGTEVFLPLKSSLEASRARGYKGTIEEINAEARNKLGFNLFDPDPFKASEVRAIESVQATEQYDFLDYVARYYGEAATDLAPGTAFARRTPQLMNVLPTDVEPEMTAVAKGILKKLEPDKVFTSASGKTYTAKDILKLADDAELISERTAGQAAKEVVEGDAGKKIVSINPSREEIARMALLADRLLNKGMSEKDAVEAAAKELKNIRIPVAIAEHLEPQVAKEGILDKTVFNVPDAAQDYFSKEEYSTLDIFDSLQSKWKWLQTVWAPAYHAQNIAGGFWNAGALGETSLQSFLDSVRILRRTDESLAGVIRSASGEERTGAELVEMAGEHGTFGQPGWMDIDKKLDPLKSDSSVIQKVSKSDIGKLVDSWGPAGAARHEENWMRFAVFLDRWKKGDTAEEAAKYSAKYLVEYMPEAYTEFERQYLLRLFPFYKYPRGNIPVQVESLLKQPGKISTLDKVSRSGNEEDVPDWTTGSLILPAQDPAQFLALQLPAQQLTWFNDPLMESLMRTSPFVKAPLESVYQSPAAGGNIGVYNEVNASGTKKPADYETRLVGTRAYIGPYGDVYPAAPFGASFLNQKPYTSPLEPYTANIGGRVVTTSASATSNTPMDEKVQKALTSVSTNQKASANDLKALFARSQMRAEDFSYDQRLAGWERDKMVSPLSGISTELQGGHLLPAALGGKAEMSNYLTQTREENYENLAAQTFMTNVPEKEFLQDQFWGDVETKYTTDLQDNMNKTAEKLNKQGMMMNEAVAEKVAYDSKKKGNIRLYTRELDKIRMQRDWAERMLRTEIRNYEKKKQTPGFQGDPVSERQIIKLNYYIPKYQSKFDEITKLREDERAKEFVLPDQIMSGEDFSFETMENPVVVKGKGPALADPDKIKNLVKYEDLAFERAYIFEYAPVIDLKRWLGPMAYLMEGKNAIKQPTGKEWVALQEEAKAMDTTIFGGEIAPKQSPVAAAPTAWEAAMSFMQSLTGSGAASAEESAAVPLPVDVTEPPTVQDTTRTKPKWVWNTGGNATGNVTKPTFEDIFGTGLDDFQKKHGNPPIAGYSDIPVLGEGIPYPYTRSGWNAKLLKDQMDAQGSVNPSGIGERSGDMYVPGEAEKFDENSFLESPEFISAVESIAMRLYDDQVYS